MLDAMQMCIYLLHQLGSPVPAEIPALFLFLQLLNIVHPDDTSLAWKAQRKLKPPPNVLLPKFL